MALKIWLNGQMKKITRYQMVTFVGGTKKKLKKGITFVNGEKKILWQTGEYGFNSWTLSELQCPYMTSSAMARICGLESNDNKIVYNVEKNICRANISNLTSPYNDGSVSNGAVTYHRAEETAGTSTMDANVAQYGANASITINKIEINQSTMDITPTTVLSYNMGTVYAPVGSNQYVDNIVYLGGSIGAVRIENANGVYTIKKQAYTSSPVTVATINGTGYSSSGKPIVWGYAVYEGRYLLLGVQYQATSGGNFVYSLRKIDLLNGGSTTLLNNKNSAINSIFVDGSDIILSTENQILKIDISGNVLDTYTSANDLTTLIGKCGNYYYLTTTRNVGTVPYMNIEIIDDSNFSSYEVHQTENKMIETICYPYESGNGYICFATKYYIASASSSSGGTINTSRSASINQLNSGGTGVTYSNVELKICRVQCY